MTGIEAASDIATGALVADAVEPHDGSHGAQGGHHADTCLNCGTRLIGSHCYACGQHAHLHRTLGAIGHDIGHAVFHFDGKALRTLPMLAFHPGDLTRRYIDGERTRFVSPMALFLFSVFLMFAILASLPGWSVGDDFLRSDVAGGMAEARGKLIEEQSRATSRIASLESDLAKERADPEPDRDRIADLEKRIAATRSAAAEIAAAAQMMPTAAANSVPANTVTPTHTDTWAQARFRHAKENPKLVLYKLKTSAYKYSWALIPLSIPFLWLLFPFSRRFGLYDHAISATYSIAFMSLLTILLACLGAIGLPLWIIITAAALIPPVHIYKQLTGTYRLGRAGGMVRTILLTVIIAGVIAPAFAAALLYLGLAD